jgi:hypothetical protein
VQPYYKKSINAGLSIDCLKPTEDKVPLSCVPTSCLSGLIQKIRAVYEATMPQVEISILSHAMLQAEVKLAANYPNARKHLEQQVRHTPV